MQTTTSTLKTPAAGNARPAAAKPWYAHRWPWLLMLGPAAVVVAGTFTIWLAFSRQDALVVDDYYKQGKAINQDLRRDDEAARRQIRLQLGYDAVHGRLEGSLAAAAGMANQDVRLLLIHPTLPASDMRFDTRTDRAGRFQITLPMLQANHWQVQVEDGQRNWRLGTEWAWPQQQRIDIEAGTSAAQ